MSVATVKGFLQTLNAGITGLSAAACPVNWPQAEIVTFPLCLARKDAGFARKVAGKLYSRDSWKFYLFLAKEHQETFTAAMNSADSYVQLFRAKYNDPANATLSYTPTLVHIANLPQQLAGPEEQRISDTGLTTIEHFQKGFYGVIFDTLVTEEQL